mmetsp:Transcript_1379/g.1979  ORF Transcript_1379/g.1979 Transcript_1379/m.1979 type:complete len:462 (-) Transcript_1379:366-1751(-)|eukprot:CAMPEP_0185726310 /NCGR_PEP_ID=MMETSP1171-20130828/2329_1 /TAXON_ID=374046 /ORGANISM="Helicotheca tamensis, Strain CCMP826" /LENGTH=461 /DNA_ID=CAMNT_0028394635 /DNA_START=72 /DNA_END=1457 /DNA_ORIENTATION=-
MSVFNGKGNKSGEEEELVEVCGGRRVDENASDGSEDSSEDEEGERLERESEGEESAVKRIGKGEVWMLGVRHSLVEEFAVVRSYESSLFWLTYRADFCEMAPYGIRSDAGWGCMLRAAQMVLAHALRRHCKGPSWTPPRSLKQRRADPFLRDLLTWLADVPHPHCFYSIHKMVAAGLPLKMLPGEWYGPTTASHVLKTLTHMHSNHLRTHVAPNATLYKQAVHQLMDEHHAHSHARTHEQPLAHPLQIRSSASPRTHHWDKALLLLVPLRLGLKTFNHTSYAQTLATTFSLPQSLGFIGGSPRHALWFYAASADGQSLYGLDPHTVQTAPVLAHKNKKSTPTNDSVIRFDDAYLRSVHCDRPSVMDMSKIDPSLSLAFYCKHHDDFHTLCTSIQRMNEHCSQQNKPILFDILQAPPDYDADVSHVMAEMCFADSNDEDDDNGVGTDEDMQQLSDEDDYVML